MERCLVLGLRPRREREEEIITKLPADRRPDLGHLLDAGEAVEPRQQGVVEGGREGHVGSGPASS